MVLAILGRRQVVRHWVLVPAFAGSNPAVPAKNFSHPGGVFYLLRINSFYVCQGFIVIHNIVAFLWCSRFKSHLFPELLSHFIAIKY